MARTSPIHYINPSAISITPNANGSANDLAVYVAKGAKIKVYAPGIEGLGVDPETGTFREWALAGRNRRLNGGDGPYTVYARLKKDDASNGYLVFSPMQQYGDDNTYGLAGQWFDSHSYVMREGFSGQYDQRGFPAVVDDPSYWWIKLGEVSASDDGGPRTVSFDTGILGTDQFYTEWSMNPDDLPLRIEVGFTMDGENAGLTPYVPWEKAVVLDARLVEGWEGDASQLVDHWTITRNTGDGDADAAWQSAEHVAAFRTSGSITLSHERGAGDDFSTAVAASFTVTAWKMAEASSSSESSSSGSSSSGEEVQGSSSDVEEAQSSSSGEEGGQSSSSGEEGFEPIATTTVTVLAEALETYELEMSDYVVVYDPKTAVYSPSGSVTVRIRAKSSSGDVFYLDQVYIATAQLHVYYLPVGEEEGEDAPPELVFADGVASLPVSVFQAGKSMNLWLENYAQVVLARTTVGYVRYGEDGSGIEFAYYRADDDSQANRPTAAVLNQRHAGTDGNPVIDDWVGADGGWYDDNPGFTAQGQVMYHSVNKYSGGTWSGWSDPVALNRYAENAVRLDIDNEMDTVFTDGYGTAQKNRNIVTTAHLYDGYNEVTITDGMISCDTISYNGGAVTAQKAASGKGKRLTWAITKGMQIGAHTYVNITVTYNNVAYSATLTVNASLGNPLYQLLPSESALKFTRNADNTLTDPAGVSLSVLRVDGTGSSVTSYTRFSNSGTVTIGDDTLYVRYGIDEMPSGISGSGSGTPWPNNAGVSAASTDKELCIALFTDGGVLLDCVTVPVVIDGEHGTSPWMADLDNEMDSVACDTDGHPASAATVSTDLSMFYGSSKEQFKVTSVRLNGGAKGIFPSGVTVKVGNVTISSASSFDSIAWATSHSVSVSYTSSATIDARHDFAVELKPRNAVTETRILHFTVNGIRPGAEGQSAVLYSLVPSCSEISVKKDGSRIPSGNITCSVVKTDGTSAPQAATTGFTLKKSVNGGSETDYSATASSSVVTSLAFILYVGGVVVDRETIPVVTDGTDGKDIIVDGSTEIAYCVSDSNTTQPADSSFKPYSQVTVTQGKWLWSKATTYYRKSTSTAGSHDAGSSSNYTVSYIAIDGSAGRSLTSVTEYYQATNSASSYSQPVSSDTGWDTDPNLSNLTNKWGATYKYLWNYEKTTYSSGTTVERTKPAVIAIWTKDGKGIDSITNYYKVSTKDGTTAANSETRPSTDGTGGWDDDPVAPTAENPFLWNYEKIHWTDNTDSYTEPQMIGHYGKDGTSPYFADLDNEMDSVACDTDGHPAATTTVATNVSMWHGSTPEAFTAGVYSDAACTSAYTNSSTLSSGIAVWWSSGSATTNTVSVKVSSAYTFNGKQTFYIKLTSTNATRVLSFVVNGVNAGPDGAPATIYNILPSISEVSVGRGEDGAYVPRYNTLQCGYKKSVGPDITTVSEATGNIDSTYRLFFRRRSRSTGTWESTYYYYNNATYKRYLVVTSGYSTSGLDALTYDSVEFILYKNTSSSTLSSLTDANIIDRETVPVISDGEDGVSITKVSETYQYATNNTGTRPSASSSDWSSTKPTLAQGYWLYTKITITWSDNSTTVLYTDERNPNDGIAGQDIIVDGSTEITYCVSDSNTTQPADSSFKPYSQVTVTQGKWLWSKATTYYRKSTSTAGSHDAGSSSNYTVSYIAIDGSAGRSLTSVTEYYQATNSASSYSQPVSSDTGWDTDPNLSNLTNKWGATYKYLWNYEKTTYSSGTTVERTKPAVIAIWTKDGKGIDSITNYYKISTKDGTTPAKSETRPATDGTEGWDDDPVAPTAENPFLWNYEKIHWTDNTDSYTDPQMIGHFGKDGVPGGNTATVYLYSRTKSTIGWTNTLTYTFETKQLSSVPTGWSQTIPSGTDPIYVTAATAYSTGSTDTIAYTEWATPVVLSENGADGLNSASVFLYQRVASAPTKPSSALTYTFATGVLSGTLGNWSQTVPSTDGNPCWVIQATAIATTATDTINASEWSEQRKLVEDGEDGTSPWVADINNEVDAVSCDDSGYVLPSGNSSQSVSTVANLYHGSAKQNCKISTVKRGSTTLTNNTASDGVTASWPTAAGTDRTLTITYASTAKITGKDDFTVTVTDSSGGNANTLHFIVNGVKGDVYNLKPGASEIVATRNASNTFDITGIICGYTKKNIDGTLTEVDDVSTTYSGEPYPLLIDGKYNIWYRKHDRSTGDWETDTSGSDTNYAWYAYNFDNASYPNMGRRGIVNNFDPNAYDAVEFLICTEIGIFRRMPTLSGIIDREIVHVVADGVNGAPGGNSATVYLYKRSASAITSVGISATLYYKFSTKKLYTNSACTTEATTQLNSWSLTIPSGTNPIYVTAAIAYSTTASDDIASSEWVTPAQFTENGEDGEHGVNTAAVFLYKRSETTISSHGISSALYYKFANGKLYTTSACTTEATTQLNGWSLTIPASDGTPCYVIQAAALSTDTYDQIATGDWSSVRKLVEDGEDGADGISGIYLSAHDTSWGRNNSGTTEPSSWGSTVLTPTASERYVWRKDEYTYDAPEYGRNLMRGTAGLGILENATTSWANGCVYGSQWNSGSGTIAVDTSQTLPIDGLTSAIKITTTTAGWGFAQGQRPLTAGKKITLSCWVKGTSGNSVALQAAWLSSSVYTGNVTFTCNGEWQHISTTGTVPSTSSNWRIGYVRLASANATLYVCGVKVEYGEADTDWTPAPEDLNVTETSVWSIYGESPIFADLDNEMDSVACNVSGVTTGGEQYVETNAQLWKGTTAQTISSITCKIGSTTLGTSYSSSTSSVAYYYKVSTTPSTGYVKVFVREGATITSKTEVTVTISATIDGASVSRSLTLTINGARAGSDGTPASIFRIMPSVDVIKRDKSGTLTPTSITCSVQNTIGSNVYTATSSDGTLRYNIDADITSSSQGSTMAIGGSVSYNSTNTFITFAFYKGTTLLDKERVPIVYDGVDGTSPWIADLDNEIDSVSCDDIGHPLASSTVSTTVCLYHGSQKQNCKIGGVTRTTSSGTTTELTNGTASNGVTASWLTSASENRTLSITYATTATIDGKDDFTVTVTDSSGGNEHTLHFTVNGIIGDVYNVYPAVSEIVAHEDGNGTIWVTEGVTSIYTLHCGYTKNANGTITTVAEETSGTVDSKYPMFYRLHHRSKNAWATWKSGTGINYDGVGTSYYERFYSGTSTVDVNIYDAVSFIITPDGSSHTGGFSQDGITIIDQEIIHVVADGAPGDDAIIYQLAPTVSSISFTYDSSGNLQPSAGVSFKANVKKTEGDTTTILTSSQTGLYIWYGWDNGSTAVAKNHAVGRSYSVVPSEASSHTSIWLELRDGTGDSAKRLDREDIPIVCDGQDGEDGAPGATGPGYKLILKRDNLYGDATWEAWGVRTTTNSWALRNYTNGAWGDYVSRNGSEVDDLFQVIGHSNDSLKTYNITFRTTSYDSNNIVGIAIGYTYTEDGQQGSQGKMGRNLWYAGVWSSFTGTFTVTDHQAPYFEVSGSPSTYWAFVGENGTWSRTSVSGATQAGDPSASNANWEQMTTQFKYLISEATFSNFAKFGGSVFNGDYQFSQYGDMRGFGGLMTEITNGTQFQYVDPNDMFGESDLMASGLIWNNNQSYTVSSTSWTSVGSLSFSGSSGRWYTIMIGGSLSALTQVCAVDAALTWRIANSGGTAIISGQIGSYNPANALRNSNVFNFYISSGATYYLQAKVSNSTNYRGFINIVRMRLCEFVPKYVIETKSGRTKVGQMSANDVRYKMELASSSTTSLKVDHQDIINVESGSSTLSIVLPAVSASLEGRHIEVINPSGRNVAYSWERNNEMFDTSGQSTVVYPEFSYASGSNFALPYGTAVTVKQVRFLCHNSNWYVIWMSSSIAPHSAVLT